MATTRIIPLHAGKGRKDQGMEPHPHQKAQAGHEVKIFLCGKFSRQDKDVAAIFHLPKHRIGNFPVRRKLKRDKENLRPKPISQRSSKDPSSRTVIKSAWRQTNRVRKREKQPLIGPIPWAKSITFFLIMTPRAMMER